MTAESLAPTDRPGATFFFALSAIGLGHTLQMSNGHQRADAMWVLTVVISVAVIAVVLPSHRALKVLDGWPLKALLALGLIWQFGQLVSTLPGIYIRTRDLLHLLPFFMGISAAAVLTGAGLSEKPLLGRWRMPLLLLVHFAIGVWLIRVSPNPVIDVDMMQREGVRALLGGKNPYTLTFPNIYGHSLFFDEKLVKDGRILLGFPYPPLSLLMAVPGQALFGDYRYGQLFCMTISGALIAYTRPGMVSQAIATVFLFTPRTFFVLEQGWTDPFLVLMLALTLFAAFRRPGLVPYAFGLLVSLKQYAVLAVLLAWLLPPRPFRFADFGRSALKAAATALVVSLPLALWDFTAFFNNLFLYQLGMPFRPDSLSFLAWLGKPPEQRVAMLSVVALGVALVLTSLRSARSGGGFAGALALLYFAFFSFGSHAFCNHYYFILGALSCAAAGSYTSAEPGERWDPAWLRTLKARFAKRSPASNHPT